MNAYELATGLENHFKGNFITSESALLLRQQADRIAELEKEIKECWCGGHSYAYLRAKNRLPQTKPLSDEEITEIAEKTLGHSMGLLNWMGFARAIEERHGIK